jgi:hypothetical protein
MVSKITKWMLKAFIVCCLIFLIVGCGEPKQSTKPGDFGHLIYRQEPKNVIEWTVVGMYLNDSLIVMGNPRYIGYRYPIFNKNTGKIVDYFEISKQ